MRTFEPNPDCGLNPEACTRTVDGPFGASCPGPPTLVFDRFAKEPDKKPVVFRATDCFIAEAAAAVCLAVCTRDCVVACKLDCVICRAGAGLVFANPPLDGRAD